MYLKTKILRSVVRAKNSNFGQKVLLFAVSLVLARSSYAQSSSGAAGFNLATTEFTQYKDPVQKLLYAIAAVISLVGAFNIYFKMQNGDQDVKKTIMMTVGGCVAFIAAATALPNFFT